MHSFILYGKFSRPACTPDKTWFNPDLSKQQDFGTEADYLAQCNEKGLASHKCSNKAVITMNYLQFGVFYVDLEQIFSSK